MPGWGRRSCGQFPPCRDSRNDRREEGLGLGIRLWGTDVQKRGLAKETITAFTVDPQGGHSAFQRNQAVRGDLVDEGTADKIDPCIDPAGAFIRAFFLQVQDTSAGTKMDPAVAGTIHRGGKNEAEVSSMTLMELPEIRQRSRAVRIAV